MADLPFVWGPHIQGSFPQRHLRSPAGPSDPTPSGSPQPRQQRFANGFKSGVGVRPGFGGGDWWPAATAIRSSRLRPRRPPRPRSSSSTRMAVVGWPLPKRLRPTLRLFLAVMLSPMATTAITQGLSERPCTVRRSLRSLWSGRSTPRQRPNHPPSASIFGVLKTLRSPARPAQHAEQCGIAKFLQRIRAGPHAERKSERWWIEDLLPQASPSAARPGDVRYMGECRCGPQDGGRQYEPHSLHVRKISLQATIRERIVLCESLPYRRIVLRGAHLQHRSVFLTPRPLSNVASCLRDVRSNRYPSAAQLAVTPFCAVAIAFATTSAC